MSEINPPNTKLPILRIIWGAVIFSLFVFVAVVHLVILPTLGEKENESLSSLPFPMHYIFMFIAAGAAVAFVFLRQKRDITVAELSHDPKAAEQERIKRSILLFAVAEMIGLLGCSILAFGAPYVQGMGLWGISFILLAMEFPRTED
ncbi:hypothetical protein L6Q79_01320 [bacterium]|nr:hypothetical protein [bacterium]NUN45549.1 hypothetical protein [bacterium]